MLNIWRKFEALLPKTPTLVGTVTTDAGGGKYVITLDGGSTVVAYSETSYSVSDRVFVQGTEIVRPAPSLPSVTIDV